MIGGIHALLLQRLPLGERVSNLQLQVPDILSEGLDGNAKTNPGLDAAELGFGFVDALEEGIERLLQVRRLGLTALPPASREKVAVIVVPEMTEADPQTNRSGDGEKKTDENEGPVPKWTVRERRLEGAKLALNRRDILWIRIGELRLQPGDLSLLFMGLRPKGAKKTKGDKGKNGGETDHHVEESRVLTPEAVLNNSIVGRLEQDRDEGNPEGKDPRFNVAPEFHRRSNDLPAHDNITGDENQTGKGVEKAVEDRAVVGGVMDLFGAR